MSSLSFLFLLLLFVSYPSLSASQKNISSFSISDSPWQPTQDQILLSPNSIFAAGFRPLPDSPILFTFSIWYNKVTNRTIVWSANTYSPVNSTASLVIDSTGELRLIESSTSGKNLWPSKNSSATGISTLVLNDEGNMTYGTWQSFDQPTDTILPNQAMNGRTLLSKNGKFNFSNSKDLFYINWTTNSYWNSDHELMVLDSKGSVTKNNGDSIITADYSNSTRLRRLTLDDDGNLRIYSYDVDSGWTVVWKAVSELCTIYGQCGPNAICMGNVSDSSTYCVCPPGFKPIQGKQDACERKIPMNNPLDTRFLQLDFVNYSGGSNQSNLNVLNFDECKSRCLANESCLGFGFKYDGTGYCVLQLERLLFGYWSPGTEAAMYLRVNRSENDEPIFTGMTNLLETTCSVRISLPSPPEDSNNNPRNIAIISTLFACELISGIVLFWAFLKKYIKYRDMAQSLGLELLPAGGPKRFTHAELRAATKDFENLIGRGGFGDVYRGELPDHRVVAVKCLKNVTGGDGEFWAEVTIVARMHHLNLVRLWGFCAEKGQRILVYEYVPNGSLDKYLFPARRVGGPENRAEMIPISIDEPKPMLDWNVRYRIALGVARAIAYLHEECLEWVLHCDIKPENILLGDDFCPKVSDFGLAKLKKKEDVVTMSRIRGTRGYMAPEWVKMDPITSKADVYSFGMVLLEIVSGVRNFEMQGSLLESEDWYLPRWAFEKVFKEKRVEDILDRHIKHCYDSGLHFEMVERMVKTAMWCLQDRPEMRPTMGKVAKMLEGSVEITEPNKPTIFFLGDD
ncbi:S-locus lectin protein kinase family protein [Tripterygium wilfordii]|uniref:Receptor-like serine/threonine-protein kinase n=1 Tax=Tripterygium wilfordii TaxID=458696 RepID=A0A7J7DP47_TRIWF|nr:G-type lectin S-receptor-like serine/threonine-protein kinase At1g34300 [Tripterygium wilfordii]KAF5748049.1 S-locus lectin protein kinase family protein [Tripterygium wilfordii]